MFGTGEFRFADFKNEREKGTVLSKKERFLLLFLASVHRFDPIDGF
jgi:hypothetical protein